MSLFSAETLDSLAMAEVLGGTTVNNCNGGNCVAQCGCNSKTGTAGCNTLTVPVNTGSVVCGSKAGCKDIEPADLPIIPDILCVDAASSCQVLP